MRRTTAKTGIQPKNLLWLSTPPKNFGGAYEAIMFDLATAIPGLLQQFLPTVRQESQRLVEDGAVIGLDELDDEVLAEVMLDQRGVNVRWAKSEAGWNGESDIEDAELHLLSLCAVLVAVQRRAARDAEEAITGPDLREFVSLRLARTVTPEEDAYLMKLEKRYQRVKQVGHILDQDMVRLHPKWAIESVEPLNLWPEIPSSVREFWDYVALALFEKNLPVPSFLRGVADVDATRKRLHAWRQAHELPVWRERIRNFALDGMRRLPKPRERCQLRMMVTLAEARLQAMREGDTYFSNLDAAMLRAFLQDHAEGALLLDTADELLLRASQSGEDGGLGEVWRMDGGAATAALAALFHQPGLADRLVTLDEVPFARPDEPLKWTGHEGQGEGTLLMKLVTASGADVPLPLIVLHGMETLYLSADTVFKGPRWLADEWRLEGEVSLPMPALASEDGINFLQQLGVEVPDTLGKRIRSEELKVRLRAYCMAKSPLSGAEFAVMQVEALDQRGVVKERLGDRGWSPVAQEETMLVEDAIICRDRRALLAAENVLAAFRVVHEGAVDGFRVRLTKDFPEQFQSWAASLDSAIELDCDNRLRSILSDPLVARVRIEASQTEIIDWFDLKMVFEIEGVDLKPAEIRRLIAARGGFVLLADGSWRRVKLELTDEQLALMESMGIDLDEPTGEVHRLHWRQLAEGKAAEVINPQAWQKVNERLLQANLEMRPEVSPNLGFTLRPYQVEGYHFLAYLAANGFGGILADDMGLGKTVQSIAWILWLRERNTAASGAPVLVVCPKSVLDVWATEFGKAAPSLRVVVLRERDELDMNRVRTGVDVLVVNYAQLRGCIADLGSMHWLAVILDEGQQIKNPDSKAARAARTLKSQNRLVLTGTPMENRLLDLWSLMTFATPGALGDRAYFQRHFDRRKDAQASERLAARLRPFLLRRTKGQVARDLPPRSEEMMLCEMGAEQSRLYQAELARAQQMVLTNSALDALNKKRFAVLQALTRLRQICCHPSLAHVTDKTAESAKLTATLDLIEELHAEGHKVLLFSQFVTMLTLIRERLEEMKVPYHWLTGASTDRAGIVKAFQEDENASVFLLSLKAGGSGLNLTAASYVILYDPWWNPAVEAQAIDRAHRIGQTQPVMAYRMLTKGTIEEKIMLLQQKKNLMANNILGEGGFSSTLDKSDFEFLFDIESKALAEAGER